MRVGVVLSHLHLAVSHQARRIAGSDDTYALSASPLLFRRVADLLSAFLMPCAEALSSKHEILIFDHDGRGPPVAV